MTNRNWSVRLAAALFAIGLYSPLAIGQDANQAQAPQQAQQVQPPQTAAEGAAPAAGAVSEYEKAVTQQLLGPSHPNVEAQLYLALQHQLIADNPLGIEVAPVEEPLRVHLKLAPTEGLIVKNAPPDSDGAKAGLQQNDLILRVVEAPVADAAAFVEVLKAYTDKPVRLKVVREGKAIEIEATIRQPRVVNVLDNQIGQYLNQIAVTAVADDRYRIGVSLADVDGTLRAHLKLPEGEGLVVTDVVADSPAAKAGVQANDILLALDGKPLTTIETINQQVQEIKDRTVTLKLLRAGEEKSLEVTPSKTSAPAASHDYQALSALLMYPHTNLSYSCQQCHQNPHQGGVYNYYHHQFGTAPQALSLLLPQQAPAPAGSTQEQLDKLKGQLEQAQSTVAALQALLGAQKQESATPEKK